MPDEISIVPPFILGDVSVLFVSVCDPDSVVTVLSIKSVFPLLFIPVPAIICPAPENCENSNEEFPISIVSDVTTKPESAFVFPFSTNEKEPDVTVVLLLKSDDLDHAPLSL